MNYQFTKQDIKFQAHGLALSGWLFKPESKNKLPAIIMTHGYAA